jgi:long-chain fatty acid transport protein
MKKCLVLILAVAVSVPLAFGAIVTNTNQSIQYFRLLARNASTDIDAVYYNPAGLVKLSDGFHLSISNQFINQDKTVISGFPLLNSSTYVGEVRVPFYPNIYAVYKKGPWAFSFGFGPNAGGGSAKYATGLPSFEIPYSELPLVFSLMGLPTSKYSVDINFEGESIYYGFQANVSYAFADWISGAVGFRYIYAHNAYTGAIQNVMLNPGLGPLISAPAFFNSIGQPGLAALVGNRTVDATQSGSGFTPILGLNLAPVEGLNIGIHYEFETSLELTNKVTKDETGTFVDGEKTNADIPAIFAIGASYAILPQLRAHVSYNLYFDRDAIFGDATNNRASYVTTNSNEFACGLEFDPVQWLTLSAGYLITTYDLNPSYQEDRDFALSANTVGFGAQLRVLPRLTIDLGAILVDYKDASKDINYGLFGIRTEKYQETTFAFGLGLGYHF